MKRYPTAVTEKNYRDVLIPGDMAPKPVEEFSILVEKVIITIVTNWISFRIT